MAFQDRRANRPNRYKVIPDSGNAYYVTLERADEPTVLGTPLSADNLNRLYSPDNKPTPDDIGALDLKGGTLTGQLRLKNGASATRGVRVDTSSGTGASIVDQTDISNDSSDRSGIKIRHDSASMDEFAQLFRTESGKTSWYTLYGKHNARLDFRFYDSLADIGLSAGSETIEAIAAGLPNSSVLCFGVTASNAKIYPTNYGIVTVKRALPSRISFEFVATNAITYNGFYSINSGGNVWSGWLTNATTTSIAPASVE